MTILLANDGVLPLAPSVMRVAVFGPGADDTRLLQGDYHYPTHLEIIYLERAPEQGANSIGEIGAETLVLHAGGEYTPGPPTSRT